MYDVKNRKWKSDCENEDLLRWSQEPANAAQPEAQFIRASSLLEKNRRGGDVAEAVALMEAAAESDYPEAVFAMGQMFYWGWAVSKDRKLAMEWYHRAAELKYKPAIRELENLKHRKIKNAVSVCAALTLVVSVAIGAFYALSGLSDRLIIKVNRDTELVQTPTYEEFAHEITELIANYDDELVISGQVSTNRLILKVEGNRLDLRDFLADKVVSRENNMVIIQFATEEEAQRCLEELSKRDGIVYVEMDEYNTHIESVREKDSSLAVVTDVRPTDSYNSWGVADMGIDQLRDYVAATYPNNEVHIAVIDSGIDSYVEQLPQIVENFNVITGTYGSVPHFHGTHVVGTVWECVVGTNTYIHCLDVFNGREGSPNVASILAIEACIASGEIDVISRSMGSAVHSAAWEDTIRHAVASGIVFVNSAGNESINVNVDVACPAEIEEAIIVAAYDIEHRPADFTNYGTTVDVSAPGVDIYSNDVENPGYLVNFNGTSMACPHIGGLAALVKLMYPDATPSKVETYIKDYCRTFRNPDMYATGMFGAGAPDATKFIEKYPDIN